MTGRHIPIGFGKFKAYIQSVWITVLFVPFAGLARSVTLLCIGMFKDDLAIALYVRALVVVNRIKGWKPVEDKEELVPVQLPPGFADADKR